MSAWPSPLSIGPPMNPPDTITAAQFQALGALLWGDAWRHEAAEALGVGLRNIQFWAAEPPARAKPVPAGVIADLMDLIAERMRDPKEDARMHQHVYRHASQTRILDLGLALGLAAIPTED